MQFLECGEYLKILFPLLDAKAKYMKFSFVPIKMLALLP